MKTPSRTLPVLAIALAASLGVSACGGDDSSPAKSDTSATKADNSEAKLENSDIKAVFEAIASQDLDKLGEVTKFVAPGSIAAAYLQEQTDAVNALIDGGESVGDNSFKKVDSTYESCTEGEDSKDSCVVWSEFESVDGKLARLKINDTSIDDRITVGDGTAKDAGDAASVEFRSSYKSVQSGFVFVNLRVTSKADPINLNSYSATYRGADKRQVTAERAAGPTEIGADSVANVSLIFKASAVGGKVSLDVLSEDFADTKTVAINTK